MKNKILFSFLVLVTLIPAVRAATNFVGQITQNTSFNGVAQPVTVSGSVSATVSGSTVQVTGLGGAAVAISAASLPLPTGAATEATLSTLNGKVTAVDTGNVTISAALPAGANTIGKVDQGTGGASAWKVDGSAVTQPISAAALPLPAGAATSANQATQNAYLLTISTTQGPNVTQPISAASLPLPTGAATSAAQTTGNSSLSSIDGKLNSLGQKTMAGSVPVVLASDQTSISVTPSLVTSANVTKSSVTATTTSTQLLAAAATRTGVECTALCTNTDYAFLNINSASAATVTDYPMSPCSSWTPPTGMVPVGAIQVIANSGNQVVRCVSYTP